jgi:hypothetical protein
MDNRNNILKTLQARVKDAREKAIAEGRAIPSVEHRNAFIERMNQQTSQSSNAFLQRLIERMKAEKESQNK